MLIALLFSLVCWFFIGRWLFGLAKRHPTLAKALFGVVRGVLGK